MQSFIRLTVGCAMVLTGKWSAIRRVSALISVLVVLKQRVVPRSQSVDHPDPKWKTLSERMYGILRESSVQLRCAKRAPLLVCSLGNGHWMMVQCFNSSCLCVHLALGVKNSSFPSEHRYISGQSAVVAA